MMAASHTPTALRLAILHSGQRQYVIARKAGIHESRFSRLVNGQLQASDEERRRLARVLRRPVPELFPEALAS